MAKPPKGIVFDPRNGGVFRITFDDGEHFAGVAFEIDAAAMFDHVRELAARDGFDMFDTSELERNRAAAAEVIALRTFRVFQAIFSAVAGDAIEAAAELAYEQSRRFLQERSSIDRTNRVTEEDLMSPLPTLQPRARKAYLKSIEQIFRRVLSTNRRGVRKKTDVDELHHEFEKRMWERAGDDDYTKSAVFAGLARELGVTRKTIRELVRVGRRACRCGSKKGA